MLLKYMGIFARGTKLTNTRPAPTQLTSQHITTRQLRKHVIASHCHDTTVTQARSNDLWRHTADATHVTPPFKQENQRNYRCAER